MLTFLLTSAALASGVIHPEVALVDPGCAAFSAEAAARWPHQRAVRVAGLVRGSTSAPGGPVMHHVFALEADGLAVTRPHCRHPEPGHFTVVGRCGSDNLLRFSGTLHPGETYWIGPEQTAWLTVTTAGDPADRDCPPPPPEPVYVDERTLLAESVRDLSLTADAVSYDADRGELTVRAEAIAAAVGLEGLHGRETLPARRPVSVPAHAQVTVRRYRHTFDEEDGMGGAWCTTQPLDEVTVVVDGTGAAVVFRRDGAGTQRDGACPQ